MASSLESKIIDLQARLQRENEANDKDPISHDIGGGFGSPRPGSGKRPQKLGEMSTPRRAKPIDLPVMFPQPKQQDAQEIDNKMKEIIKLSGVLCIDGKKYHSEIRDLEDLGELGNGTCGHVVKMLHKPSQKVIAVKQMRRSGNSEENKRIIMDLDVVLKSECPYIVQCLGCFITEADVWICMELMATCFDKLLKRLRSPIPEQVLGRITLATVKALHYLKENHDVIHRDVKPSNILVDEKGNVKLCDFGISGRLVDSKAKTKNAGCAAYMAPERIDPPDPRRPAYDIRADVWSLGITLVEMATGVFPYKDCKCDFEVLSKVMQDDPPALPTDQGFTQDFQSFVKWCLTKNYKNRPKYRDLLDHPFLKLYERESVNVASWFGLTLSQIEPPAAVTPIPTPLPVAVPVPATVPAAVPVSMVQRFTPPPPSPSTRRHAPLPLQHHRSLSETCSYQSNGELPSGRYSPFRMGDPPPISPRYQNTAPEWDRSRMYSGIMPSPIPTRKRFQDPLPGNTSPLMLQRFHHQQSQHNRSTSVSPCRQYTSETVKLEDSGNKKRYSSFVKLQVGGSLPPPHSPEPPPRHNRMTSPLLRRNFIETSSPSPARRTFQESSQSPLLSRRHVSPAPPQPPPRRLSDCNSVPGSPRRPARFQHTPEPQRRVVHNREVVSSFLGSAKQLVNKAVWYSHRLVSGSSSRSEKHQTHHVALGN
ncbi:dual specificity mitogen-activated protein kinase kinase 7-like [Macrosteles quadrilineatus]|uniref:dual specificity mitogen-activated protein kinase kinase 7-like n=1 Tax=Macrosteles quadrilineatus TaxID=74068 RepID=UPI0023E1A006|nr:dual specificity mitogen-activated protein kinase kinase 7-like [Macrosteles quadrilineatus]